MTNQRPNPYHLNPVDQLRLERQQLTSKAWEMRANGHSLYAIAVALGVSKEWLREYAGLSDRR
jgi:hypothetical protein